MWYFTSREPTHWSQAIFLGSAWSEGLTRWPPKGPEAERIRSNSREVTTLGKRGVMVGLALDGLKV